MSTTIKLFYPQPAEVTVFPRADFVTLTFTNHGTTIRVFVRDLTALELWLQEALAEVAVARADIAESLASLASWIPGRR